MSSKPVAINYIDDSTIYWFPISRPLSTWNTYRVQAVQDDPGQYFAVLTTEATDATKDAFALWGLYEGETQPTTINAALERVSALPSLNDSIVTSIELIEAQANLIGTANAVVTAQPVDVETNELNPLFIGKDYLEPENAFVFTVDAPSHYTVGDATCYFGGKTVLGDEWQVEGTVTDAGGGSWTLTFELPSSASVGFSPAKASYSVELRGPNPEKDHKITGCTEWVQTYS